MAAENNKIKFKIQGHEKFSLREGWITKGLSTVDGNPRIFQDRNATDTFGIGSNMVKSLRYWLKAFNLIVEKPSSGAKLTDIGNIIKANDLYIEDYFTLGVLHYQIVTNITNATTWYMYFNKCESSDLKKDQIEEVLLREIKKYVAGQKFSEKSVRTDMDVLLNMYSKLKDNSDPEDKNISPFSALKLISNLDGVYSRTAPDRYMINEWLTLYILSVIMQNKESIAIEKVIDGDCGLKKSFNLSPVVSNEYLDRIEAMGYITVNRTAGLDIIYKSKEFSPTEIMSEYYRKHK